MCYDRSEASENVYMRAFKIKAVKARNIQLFEQGGVKKISAEVILQVGKVCVRRAAKGIRVSYVFSAMESPFMLSVLLRKAVRHKAGPEPRRDRQIRETS